VKAGIFILVHLLNIV